ncbi:NADPH-dependent 2,4-dienoyl-CoA reductase/sulfur reductase-like enzyme [Sinobaca qinghaiensis]|uniref:NADPH-dependent 2,4-dienoyl-CoA reductase/sulfur reductase-like enzyme n=1 Tax=Sinobaca qinghaiensis TaxID=342944 RepID=A0A419V7I2_9BACL|nr:FAD-dependent oxidoreductase [Sinobaca qinghaiensis]RKD76076.1 NADPH-dependent 2,4-dienoyl-CoA reductase/sulfur reductase-like enzyme [Sinobaca qinghaiensis]
MKYVIIGGDAAGMSAAMQLVRNTKQADITTLERGTIYSYAQCGLPYIAGGVVSKTEDLIARKVETFRSKYGIDARTLHHVTKVDAKQKTVSGTDLSSGDPFTVSYDKLLVASGGSPTVPEWSGTDKEGVHTVKTIPDIEKIVKELPSVQETVIVGGGYIGLEMAENLIRNGQNVRMIQRGSHLASMFDPDMGDMIIDEATKHGVTLHLEENVTSINGESRVSSISTESGTYPADLVIIATGLSPNTDFLQGSGVELFDNGAVIVNKKMETNIDSIYAAGDCAVQFHRMKEKNDYIPLGTHANKQGRLAGLNMGGTSKEFKGINGTSILQFFDLTLARTGLSEAEAREENIPCVSTVSKSSHIAGYFPGHKELTIKLLHQKESRKLIGAQVIGEAGADKRIDVLATAMYYGATIDELEDLDLSYAPPYNGVWDPIQQTARRAKS